MGEIDERERGFLCNRIMSQKVETKFLLHFGWRSKIKMLKIPFSSLNYRVNFILVSKFFYFVLILKRFHLFYYYSQS